MVGSLALKSIRMRAGIFVCLIWSISLPSVDPCAATSPQNEPQPTTTTTVAPNSRCGQMCRELTVKRDSDDSQPVIQTPIENAGNGCPGFTETCQGTDADSAVVFTYYDEDGNDVGSTFGTGMAAATLACGPGNKLTFNDTKVDQVECISA